MFGLRPTSVVRFSSNSVITVYISQRTRIDFFLSRAEWCYTESCTLSAASPPAVINICRRKKNREIPPFSSRRQYKYQNRLEYGLLKNTCDAGSKVFFILPVTRATNQRPYNRLLQPLIFPNISNVHV